MWILENIILIYTVSEEISSRILIIEFFLCTIPALLIHSWGDGSNGNGFDDFLQASFTPFITEHNYQALRPYIPESMNSEETESIHYLMIPQAR